MQVYLLETLRSQGYELSLSFVHSLLNSDLLVDRCLQVGKDNMTVLIALGDE